MGPYSGEPEDGSTPPRKSTAPTSVAIAIKLIWTSVALGLLSTIFSFVFLDAIVDIAAKTTDGMNRDVARLGAIAAAIVGFLLSVVLAAVFAYFIGKGANWARIAYTVLLGFTILSSIAGLSGPKPALLLILTALSLVLSVAIFFFLYRPDSNAYFKAVRHAN